MDFKEYEEKKEFMKKRHKTELYTLAKNFCLSNNTIKIGDIVTDHMGSIMVEALSTVSGGYMNDVPECVYRGICYTKAGKPFKSRETRSIYESNIKKD